MKIIKFSTDKCPSCRKLTSILDVLELNYEENILVMPDDLEIVRRYNLNTMPTMIKFNDNDEEIDRVVGLVTVSKIKEFFEV